MKLSNENEKGLKTSFSKRKGEHKAGKKEGILNRAFKLSNYSPILKLTVALALFLIAAVFISGAGVIVEDGALNVSNDMLVNTNTLYVDSTNNRVGIGTSNPTSKLYIDSTETNGIYVFSVQTTDANQGALTSRIEVRNPTATNPISTALSPSILHYGGGNAGWIRGTRSAITLGAGTTTGTSTFKIFRGLQSTIADTYSDGSVGRQNYDGQYIYGVDIANVWQSSLDAQGGVTSADVYTMFNIGAGVNSQCGGCDNPSLNATEFYALKIGTQTNMGQVDATGIYLGAVTGATNNYGIVLDGDSTGSADLGSAIVFGAEQDASIYWDGTNLIFNTTQGSPTSNTSAIAWFSSAVSATNFTTRTSVYDKNKGSAMDYIKDSDDYKTNGEIDHSQFYGYTTQLVTDTSNCWEVQEYVEYCWIGIDEEYYCVPNEKDAGAGYNLINHTRTECGKMPENAVNLNAEVDVLRQAVYDLKTELCTVSGDAYNWC